MTIPAYCPRCNRHITSVDQVALSPTLQRVTIDGDKPTWDDLRWDSQGEYGHAIGYQCPQCRHKFSEKASAAIAKRIKSTYHKVEMVQGE